MTGQRLQKILAAAGIGSRRTCEKFIEDGRVRVNGRVARTLPVMVDPAADRITVDGKRIRGERQVYYLLNKPRGVLCTHRDPAGRKRAIDCLGRVRERVFPVGRLDATSTGLLLLTNDGGLAERITHPRYGVPKTYRAEVVGRIEPDALDRLRRGVWLAEGKTAPARARIVHRDRKRTILEITLREGKNREVRRVLARLGHKVRNLKRIAIGPLSLGSLPSGAYRSLTPKELTQLKRSSRPAADQKK
ncbi:MAG: pseudouridine synthase [Phycisphaerae bacterium]